MALSKILPASQEHFAGARNLIINGAMQVAQRGTSFTTDNVYTIDRWKSGDGTGGSPARTLSQEEFALGQTSVPNARYYLKHDQTGASTNGNASLVHKIEDVTRFDGQTVTLSFYAKADASMNIDIRFIQDFGSGGSPSSDVELNEIVSIGTSWTKYTVTKTLGSLSGKTVGTDGEHTSSLTINIDFEPTSTFTFEATLFQLEYGETASPFEHRSYGDELIRCQRYYQTLKVLGVNYSAGVSYNGGSNAVLLTSNFLKMRAAPTITFDNSGNIEYYNGSSWVDTTVSVQDTSDNYTVIVATGAGRSPGSLIRTDQGSSLHALLSAEL